MNVTQICFDIKENVKRRTNANIRILVPRLIALKRPQMNVTQIRLRIETKISEEKSECRDLISFLSLPELY